jgi:hypothetical protein
MERMNSKDTLAAINQMQADGVIERYAIGGAVGATFIISRHGLREAWQRFEQQFLGDIR